VQPHQQISRRRIRSGSQGSQDAAMPKWQAHGAQQLLLEACAAADSSLQPMGAFIQVQPCDATRAPWTAFNDVTAFAVHYTSQVYSVQSD
jgi:hypothetical protein